MGRPLHRSKQIDAVLAALARDPERWRFGYELSREVGVGSGTLYPALVRLADAGLLEHRWEHPPGQRPRHVYRLTTDGVELARERLTRREGPQPAPHAATGDAR
jgi:DNA-binding PadR family transcriptional regulator